MVFYTNCRLYKCFINHIWVHCVENYGIPRQLDAKKINYVLLGIVKGYLLCYACCLYIFFGGCSFFIRKIKKNPYVLTSKFCFTILSIKHLGRKHMWMINPIIVCLTYITNITNFKLVFLSIFLSSHVLLSSTLIFFSLHYISYSWYFSKIAWKPSFNILCLCVLDRNI